jgi:hypothetical protein
MKPDEIKLRTRLALWLLLGALVLTLIGIATWRIVHYVFIWQVSKVSTAIVSSAWKITRGSALALSGVNLYRLSAPCMGKMTPKQPNPHPTARLYYSSLSPSDQIASGQVLHATAIFECSPDLGVPVLTNETGYIFSRLYDDGTHGDRVTDDGIWEVDYIWKSSYMQQMQVILAIDNDYDYISGASAELKEVSDHHDLPDSSAEASPNSDAVAGAAEAR